MGSFRFTFIQDSKANKQDYVQLGLSCADVCKALDRGLGRRQLDELSQSLLEAIEQLTVYVQLTVCTLIGLVTKVSIAELWLRSEGRSSTKVNDARSLEPFTRRTTNIRLLGGSRTSVASFRSLTYVLRRSCLIFPDSPHFRPS